MKKLIIALLFSLPLLSACNYNDNSTSQRLSQISQEETNKDGLNKGLQAAMGCEVAQISKSSSNMLHNASNANNIQCDQTKVKENGADQLGVGLMEILQLILFFASLAMTISVALVLFEILTEEKQDHKKKKIFALVVTFLITVLLFVPFITVSTSGNIKYKVTGFALIKTSLLQTTNDAVVTDLEKIMDRLKFYFPNIKMPIKAGNTSNFETFADYLINAHAGNKNPVVIKFYKEGEKIVGRSYYKNLKAEISMSIDKNAIELAKKHNFKDVEAYQISEIQKAFEKSFNYANRTALTAGRAYSDNSAFTSRKTFDLTSLKSDELNCEGYANIQDLSSYTTASIQGAYRKAVAACASTILADEISSYRNLTSNAALKMSNLKNNYIPYCVSNDGPEKNVLTLTDAKEKAKSCAIEACSSSVFMCSIGLNIYNAYDEEIENVVKANSYTKAPALIFMGSNNPDFQETANIYLNSFNIEFEEIEEEKIVANSAVPIFTISLDGYLGLDSGDWDTSMGFIDKAYTEISGFSVKLPSFSDIASIFDFGESGRFGLTEASSCLKNQLQNTKDGYSCGTVIDTQRLFFLRLFKNGIDGFTMKTFLTSQSKSVKNNLNAEIKKQTTALAATLGTVAKIGLYIAGTSSDKNLYGVYTKDLTLQPEQALIYAAMFFANPQVLEFLGKFFTGEIVIGLSGYYLIPVIVMTMFISQQITFFVNIIFSFVFHSFQALGRIAKGVKNHDTVSMPDFIKQLYIALLYIVLIPLSFTMAWILLNAFFAELPPVIEMAEAMVAFEPSSLLSAFQYDITVMLLATFLIFMITTVALTPIAMTTVIASWMAFKQRGFMEVEEDIHTEIKEYWHKK